MEMRSWIDVLSFFVWFNRKKDFFLRENEYKWKASYITSNIMVPTDPTYGLFLKYVIKRGYVNKKSV